MHRKIINLSAATLLIIGGLSSGCGRDIVSTNVRGRDPVGLASTLAGDGQAGPATDGLGRAVHFEAPAAVAVGRDSIVYVADAGNHTIRRISATGQVSTLAGVAGEAGTTNGKGAEARFTAPTGLAVDALGTVYVVENSASIRKITPTGVVSTFITLDPEPAAPTAAHRLAGLTIAPNGSLYVADAGLHIIYRISAGGMVEVLAGVPGRAGFADNLRPGKALFDSPQGVALGQDGRLFVADVNNYTLRTIDSDGRVATLAGFGGRRGGGNGRGDKIGFDAPTGVATDAGGALYVTDAHSHVVRRITYDPLTLWVGTPRDSWVSTWVGSPYETGHQDGQGAEARLANPVGVAVGHDGTVYIAEQQGRVIRAVKPEAPLNDRPRERFSWLRLGRHGNSPAPSRS